MKVLHIIQRYPPAIGGSESWCSNLCHFLADKGIIVRVATINLYNIEEFFKELPYDKEGYFKFGRYDFDNRIFIRRYKLWSFAYVNLSVKIANLLLYKLKLYKTEMGSIFKHSPHSFEMYFKISKEIKNADIVHLHTLPYFHNIIGFLIAKIYGKKIVITPHFHPGHAHYERKIFYKIMDKCDAVITVSKYEKDYLIGKGIPSHKIYITGNSINKESHISKEESDVFAAGLFKKYSLNEKSKKIIFIGRKEIHKGIGTLIEAAKELANEIDAEICLFLIGQTVTEFTKRYPDLANMGRLKVIDFGTVSESEKENLLKLSDVLVLPSEFEAFGIVFLEAWKYKKPVIGSDRGVIPTLIKDAGLCTKYGDVSDLKEKIKTILFDTKLAIKLGERGREKLEKEISLENIGSNVFNIYRRIRRNKKRLLIVSNLFPPYAKGGAEIVAYQQCLMLKKIGYEIKVFAGMWENKIKRFCIKKEKREFEITRINLHDIDFDRNSINFEKKEVQNEFSKLLYEFAPDMVHFHNIYSLCLKIIDECHYMKIPTLMTLHDYWFICFKNILITDERSVCNKKSINCHFCEEIYFNNDGDIKTLSERNRIFMQHLNLIDLVISPSHYLIKRFVDCGLLSSKAIVINNGIDVSRFKYIKKSVSKKIRFGYIGQIIEHKGIEELLFSFSLLPKEERKRVSLLIVGSGEKVFVDHYQKLTKELKLIDLVTFAGKVANTHIPKLLSNIDFLIVPSVWPENSPVTIMEAFASGTPVLASDIGGIPELVKHGINGYLHKHDESKSLSENIKKVIARPKIIDEMRKTCLSEIKEYDLGNQAKKIAEHYECFINRG
jgi:glycosyltransferase involved in cell wall biosynthesis